MTTSEELALRALSPRQVDSFWSKIDRSGSCWLWLKGTDRAGYGKFQVWNPDRPPDQFHVRAHRFALALTLGRPLNGLVLHSCDEPRCCNPAHLREGTQAENIADMDSRGRRGTIANEKRARGERHTSRLHPERTARGSRHGSAKLTESVVTLIRSAVANGARRDGLAAGFKVRKSTIDSIVARRTWRHVP
jgi:hypothetical protein